MTTKEKTMTTKEKTKTIPLKTLLSRISKHEKAASLLRTAAESGWLMEEHLITRVSSQEVEKCKEAFKNFLKNNPEAKENAEILNVRSYLPQTVGSLLDTVKHTKLGTRLTSITGVQVTVDTDRFTTLQRRHPDSHVYLPTGDDDQLVVFSTANGPVGALPIKK